MVALHSASDPVHRFTKCFPKYLLVTNIPILAYNPKYVILVANMPILANNYQLYSSSEYADDVQICTMFTWFSTMNRTYTLLTRPTISSIKFSSCVDDQRIGRRYTDLHKSTLETFQQIRWTLSVCIGSGSSLIKSFNKYQCNVQSGGGYSVLDVWLVFLKCDCYPTTHTGKLEKYMMSALAFMWKLQCYTLSS